MKSAKNEGNFDDLADFSFTRSGDKTAQDQVVSPWRCCECAEKWVLVEKENGRRVTPVEEREKRQWIIPCRVVARSKERLGPCIFPARL